MPCHSNAQKLSDSENKIEVKKMITLTDNDFPKMDESSSWKLLTILEKSKILTCLDGFIYLLIINVLFLYVGVLFVMLCVNPLM